MPHRIRILRVEDRPSMADEGPIAVGSIHISPTQDSSTLVLSIVTQDHMPEGVVKTWPIGGGRMLAVVHHHKALSRAARPTLLRLG